MSCWAGVLHKFYNLKPFERVISYCRQRLLFFPSPDCYVADEIITSAAGVRVRVGNTDAEGRMAMTDPLYHTKQQVCQELIVWSTSHTSHPESSNILFSAGRGYKVAVCQNVFLNNTENIYINSLHV